MVCGVCVWMFLPETRLQAFLQVWPPGPGKVYSHCLCKAETYAPPAARAGSLKFLQLLPVRAGGQQRLFSKTSNLWSLQGRAEKAWRHPLASVAPVTASISLVSEPATQALSLPSAYFSLGTGGSKTDPAQSQTSPCKSPRNTMTFCRNDVLLFKVHPLLN